MTNLKSKEEVEREFDKKFLIMNINKPKSPPVFLVNGSKEQIKSHQSTAILEVLAAIVTGKQCVIS